MTYKNAQSLSSEEHGCSLAAVLTRRPQAQTAAVRVAIVDDDPAVLRGMVRLLRACGFDPIPYASAESLLAEVRELHPLCVIADLKLPGIDGLDLQEALAAIGPDLPLVFISGTGDVRSSVQAMRRGAIDFLPKPFTEAELFDALQRALASARAANEQKAHGAHFQRRLESLTPREHDVFALLIEGLLNKQIAWQLGIAEKTVKIHRGRIMRKMDVRSVTQLARMAERFGASGAQQAPEPTATKVLLPGAGARSINGGHGGRRGAHRDRGRPGVGSSRPD